MDREFHSNKLLNRWQAWLYVGVFTLIVLSLVVSNVLALFRGDYSQTEKNGWHDFAHGRPMHALAIDLRHTPFTDWLGEQQREFGWIALVDAGPRVRMGCPGWMFLMDELKTYPNAKNNIEQKLQIIKHLQKNFAKQGTSVVIALVPDKTRIESEHLCGLQRPESIESRYAFMINGLKNAEIPVVNLNKVLKKDDRPKHAMFYKTDTHWNPSGAKFSALAIAQRLHELGFTPNPRVEVQEQHGSKYERWGDLVHLAGLNKLPESLRPKPDTARHLSFEYNASSAVETNAATLFGNNQTERVALVGTSFSRNSHFADFLAQSLHSEVGNFAIDGGGFAKSMLSYIKTEKQTKLPVQWLIWEIPERMLQSPLSKSSREKLLNYK